MLGLVLERASWSGREHRRAALAPRVPRGLADEQGRHARRWIWRSWCWPAVLWQVSTRAPAEQLLPAAVADRRPDVPAVVLRPGRAPVPHPRRDRQHPAQPGPGPGRAGHRRGGGVVRSAWPWGVPRPRPASWTRCSSSPGRCPRSPWSRCSSPCSGSAPRWRWPPSCSAPSGRSCSTRRTGPGSSIRSRWRRPGRSGCRPGSGWSG